MNVLLTLTLLICSAFAKDPVLNDSNTVTLTGEINKRKLEDVRKEIVSKANTNDTVFLVINSPGGDVVATEAFIEKIRKSKIKVDTVSIFAAGAAFNLVQALGKRYITRKGVMVAINSSMGFVEGELVGQILERMKKIKPTFESINDRTARRMGLSKTKLKELTFNELWMNSNDAIKLKAADQVLDSTVSIK